MVVLDKGGIDGIVTLPVTLARIPRRWTLRNQRGDDGPPLTAGERHISPHADIPALIGAVVAQAIDDLDAGYSAEWGGTANERYWRAQSYLWFFHGDPTGFARFVARLGIDGRGRWPDCPLLHDAAALEARRHDLGRLDLPLDLFDRRIAQLDNGKGE